MRWPPNRGSRSSSPGERPPAPARSGEHDFDAGVGYGRLSDAHCLTVVQDAAEITRALVGPDRRYANIPGWQPLKEPGRPGRAAEVCAAYGDPDFTVALFLR